MRTVFFYDAVAARMGVPGLFIGTPFIVDEDGAVVTSMTEYLLARRNGDFAGKGVAGIDAELRGLTTLKCKPNYLRDLAYRLDVYRRWCRSECLVAEQVQVNDLERFAVQLESGHLTSKAASLDPTTVNHSLRAVQDYLRFCVNTGRRSRLAIPYKSARAIRRRIRSARKSERRYSQQGQRSVLVRRQNPKSIIDWYLPEEIKVFLDTFNRAHYKLGAQIIYGCGLRISEMLSLDIDDLPTPDAWRQSHRNRYVSVRGKNGKHRLAEVELDLVKKVDSYKSTKRPEALKVFGRQTSRLIVGQNGLVSPRMFQRATKAVAISCEMTSITPHIIRHHYAAHFLMRASAKRLQEGMLMDELPVHYLSNELIRLKENLGHAHIETTYVYLRGLAILTGRSESDSLRAELADD
jgi:site-specific recombinase XerD